MKLNGPKKADKMRRGSPEVAAQSNECSQPYLQSLSFREQLRFTEGFVGVVSSKHERTRPDSRQWCSTCRLLILTKSLILLFHTDTFYAVHLSIRDFDLGGAGGLKILQLISLHQRIYGPSQNR